MASFLKGLSDIAGDYDAILCDVWGVIHNGRESFGDACIALKKFRETRGPVILITNAPVPKHRVTGLFPQLGVPMDCFDDCVASGDATRNELARLEISGSLSGSSPRLATCSRNFGSHRYVKFTSSSCK